MPEYDGLHATLGDGWDVLATGVTREKDGTLTASVVYRNGQPVHLDRLALDRPEARQAFATAAAAKAPAGPPQARIESALLALAADALTSPPEPAAPKTTQAEQLITLAADADLWHTPDGKPYATMPVGQHREHWPLMSRGFRDWLAHRFYREHGKAPGGQAMQDALTTLAGRARFDGLEHPVFVRLAEHDGAIYLDLGNAHWEAVVIGPDGWQIVAPPPVRFRRPRGLVALPYPIAGGRLDQLRDFLNDGGDDDTWRLFVAWTLAAYRPGRPLPILALHGEQGSAKSTTARVLRRLVDPNITDLRTLPKDERDLAIAANNAWIVAFDNLSRLPDSLSDALCRLSTGGGFATRELYSDDEEALFDLRRPVLLNGIEDLATRPDLLERTIVRHLPAIPEERRRDEDTFWRDFTAAEPAILGALLTAVSSALAHLPTTTLARKPRMADFALWVTAAEPALGWPEGAFLRAYEGNRAALNDLALDASPVAVAVQQLAANYTSDTPWEGTATDLIDKLSSTAGERATRARDWPKTGRAMSGILRRYAPNLRAAGVVVGNRRAAGGKRIVSLYQNTAANDRHDRHDRHPGRQDGGDGVTVRDGPASHADVAASPSSPEATTRIDPLRRPGAESAPATGRRDDGDGGDADLRGSSASPATPPAPPSPPASGDDAAWAVYRRDYAAYRAALSGTSGAAE